VKFGGYEFLPPQGYWYFPRQLPTDFRKKKDYFPVITFAANRKDMPHKSRKYERGEQFLFYNFALAENKYGSLEAMYNAARQAGVHFSELPPEAETLNKIPNWSCKQSEPYTTIVCNSLNNDLLSIYVFGSNRAEVLATIPQLKKMIESVHVEQP
jgi:hypothetical protein